MDCNKGKLKVLDLFSGIGGFSLGLERAGMETVAFCENDKHCRNILRKHWPDIKIFNDVAKLNSIHNVGCQRQTSASGSNFEILGDIDVIAGGFPCQDISVGGPGEGIGGTRSGLWKEYWRVINEVKPKYAIIENVERLRKKGLGVVLRDLSEIGYNAEWHCITARSIGLHHQRDRLFVIAHRGRVGLHEYFGEERFLQTYKEWQSEALYPEGKRCQLEFGTFRTILSRREIDSIRSAYADEFSIVPRLRRVTHGVPTRVVEKERQLRIKQLGNAVIPQIPELIGRAIVEHERGI